MSHNMSAMSNGISRGRPSVLPVSLELCPANHGASHSVCNIDPQVQPHGPRWPRGLKSGSDPSACSRTPDRTPHPGFKVCRSQHANRVYSFFLSMVLGPNISPDLNHVPTGGIVDRNRYKGLCLERAEAQVRSLREGLRQHPKTLDS